jgi:type II secretory pathway component PulK
VTTRQRPQTETGSVFIIVLWVVFGLVSITVFFGSSMSLELRASDNRASGLAAEQAINGAARYVGHILANLQTNGMTPDPASYRAEAVPVGESHFWLIGRDANGQDQPDVLTFGLVDESSKINLNYAPSNMLASLVTEITGADPDLAPAILDWRDTNGVGAYQLYYNMQSVPYQTKSAPFETVDELRLVKGGDMATLIGEDVNRNGVLDPDEDSNQNGQLDAGLLDYVTVYSREPNTNTSGGPRIDVRTIQPTATDELYSLLQTNISSTRADQIMSALFPSTGPGGGGGGGGNNRGGGGSNRGGGSGSFRPGANARPFNATSPLDFYQQCHNPPGNMTADEFALIANYITVTNGSFILGRVNVNTASAAVLACLPGISDTPGLEQQLINYRQTNPDNLGSIAWVVDALGQNNATALETLQAGDYITTQSYQFAADVAAVGPHGRGYRRVRFVFDTSDGTTKIVYRQDLSHLGWALGKTVRQVWMAQNTQ